jgi:hypothetical protein
MRTLLLFPLLSLTLLAPLRAQAPSVWIPEECQAILKDLDPSLPPEKLASVYDDAFKLKRSPTCYARLFVGNSGVASAGFGDFLKKLEALRTDKQAGASTGAGGGTNLASKGTTAKVLSVAAEYGALTETVNQQVVTVQGSLDAPFAALVRKNLISYCLETSKDSKGCAGEAFYSALRRFSYGVSFNTNPNNQTVNGTASGQPNGAAQPVTFTASGKEVTAWNARFVLWNARDNVSKDFQSKWDAALKSTGTATPSSGGSAGGKGAAGGGGAGGGAAAGKGAAKPAPDTTSADGSVTSTTQLTSAAKALIKPLEDLIASAQIPQPDFDKWHNDSVSALKAVDLKNTDAVSRVWRQRVDLYLAMVQNNNPKVNEAAIAFIQAMSLYDFEQRAFVEAIETKPVATFEYTNNRPLGQASTSNFRLIFDKGFKNGLSLTANGAGTVYNSALPQNIPGVSRFRDAQFALQVQKDLGTVALLGAAALSATYYFQYQNSPAVLNVSPGSLPSGITFTGLPADATQVFATKGDIHVGQIRLVLSPGQSSVRFPLAISYSNRTELIPKPTWKAQLGISYDFDSLFTKQ